MHTINNLLDALMFAADAHKGQIRKYDNSPYINHLIEVGSLLTNHCKVTDHNVLQAAILHDVLEDTPISKSDLEDRFGEDVRILVARLTDDKSLPLDERRASQLVHVRKSDWRIKLIKLADHCSNIAAIPPSWSEERIDSYVDWSITVSRACAGVCVDLDNEYLRRLAEIQN